MESYDPSLHDERLSSDIESMDDQQQTLNPDFLQLSKSQIAHIRESPAARERRLARNAERMREKRSNESFEEYKKRLEKNALNNRMKRHGESGTEKAMRQVRDAARQRLRRAMETPEQRALRLEKLAERMRLVRRHETPEKRAERLAKAAIRSRERLQRETSVERKIRLQKSSEYARKIRSSKSMSSSMSDNDIDAGEPNCQPNIVISCPQSYQPQVAPCKNESLINIPRAAIQYQLNSPTNYYYTTDTNNSYSLVPADSLIPMSNRESPNIRFVIQPASFASNITTLNIPQCQSIQSVQNHFYNEAPIVKSETSPQNKSRGRPRKAQSYEEVHVKVEAIRPKIEVKLEQPVPEDISTDSERKEKLRLIAEKSRLRRKNESQEQREKRLNDLKERARRRRELVKINETEDEKKERLANQAEYARSRRVKLNSVDEKLKIEKKARELYVKIHDTQLLEKPSVLKILEPIIEMNTFT